MSEAASEKQSPPSGGSAPSGGAKGPQADGAITCPFCKDNVPQLYQIETGMKLRLKQEAGFDNVPDQVCDGCVRQFAKSISKGAVLRSEARAKEQNRMLLWKNRVQLVKQAKSCLEKKNYSDAAVAYEKYLRILEIVYEVKAGELSTELFKAKERQQELTVIASVYWDLLCIYDTHNVYRDRQMKAAIKLADFIRFAPIFPHVMRKAEAQTRRAKNPAAFREFIKHAQTNRPRCFIATAAYEGHHHPVVADLCSFRDSHLKRRPWGRLFILLYYRYSPAFADFLDSHPGLKPATRKALATIAKSRFIRNRLSPQ